MALQAQQEVDGDEGEGGEEEEEDDDDEGMMGHGVGELISACPEACCPLVAV
jgi:hypothetical protein